MSEEEKQPDQTFPLPSGVREKHGSWHYVQKHKWTKLCRIEEGRARLYECLGDLGGEGSVWHAIISYLRFGMDQLAPATRSEYRTTGLRMLHHFGHFQLSEMEPTHGAQFLKWCRQNNRATTGNREKSFMSSVFEYAMAEGWCTHNPWRGVRRNKERPSKVYVEHADLVRELDRAPPELYPLMGVAYLLTIRQTDLRLVQKSQLVREGERRILKLTESKTGKHNDHEITPTVAYLFEKAAEHADSVAKRYELAALRLEALSQVRRAAASREHAAAVRAQTFVFLSHRGLPWTEWGLQSALRRFGAGFQFRQLRPKGQTDRQDKSTTGHTGQMLEVYIRRRRLSAVK